MKLGLDAISFGLDVIEARSVIVLPKYIGLFSARASITVL
jgi:hypothetical protein